MGEGMGIRRLIGLGQRPDDAERAMIDRQRKLCLRVKASYLSVGNVEKIGVSKGVLEDPQWPIHGVRVKPERGTCGWYIWTGKHDPDDPDFFAPVHAKHLFEVRPDICDYLGMSPGWRFLIAPNHEDIWFDQDALKSDH
ncbi:immunity protein Imm33 domain-containing protein [Streptomyces sp. 3214.6]|uniref:immunity protein Imm33 domain-containing protein n=1 Tax=Streptomyces sp. 3214.6 TaxID=1882757 RepID=UPI00117F2853|nr:hypothetical protein [Streptomyces sp. 3214.6]